MVMTDIEKAISVLPDVWDDNNTGRPNKIAAMAFKQCRNCMMQVR